MSLEKIQLPNFLIAELYKVSLVDLETLATKEVLPEAKKLPVLSEEISASSQKIKYLGENQKKVAIVVNQPEAVFLNEGDLTFLTNILKACQLNLPDIAIINIANQEVQYPVIKKQLQPQTILLFDVKPSKIKLPFLIPSFQLQKFDDRIILVAPALPFLNNPTSEGKLLKTKLWHSLKQVFNI